MGRHAQRKSQTQLTFHSPFIECLFCLRLWQKSRMESLPHRVCGLAKFSDKLIHNCHNSEIHYLIEKLQEARGGKGTIPIGREVNKGFLEEVIGKLSLKLV